MVTAAGRSALNAMVSGAPPAAPPDLGESAEAEQKRAGALAEAVQLTGGLTATVVTAGRSRSAVERDKDALIEWSSDPRFADAGIWQTSVERSTGRVIVTAAKLTPLLAETIVAKYGTRDVAVEIQPNPNLELNVGRLADDHPFWGGARINAPRGSCTDAFAWRVGSVPAMATAGHCAPPAEASARPPPRWAA